MAEVLKHLKLGDIKPSPTNPRKAFTEKDMKELVDSIRENGLAQPMLVRPQGKGFELVSGERRLRAMKLLKLDTAPCFVRELTDKEAGALQQIENLQRADLAPMEEALGFDQLFNQDMPTTEIAAKVGKPVPYVLRRMRLLTLSPKAQKYLADGKLRLACAEELTRVTGHKDQDAVLGNTWDPYGDEEDNAWKNPAEMKRHIEEHVLLELSKAPFKTGDAALCPKAGACTTCPKRTGNQGALFAGAEKDLCLDAKCWKEKVQASQKAVLDKFKKEGKTVLQGKAAENAIAELPGLDKSTSHLKGGITWRQAMAEVEGFEPVLAVGRDGHHEKVFELVDTVKWRDKIPAAMKSKGRDQGDDEDGAGESSGRRQGGGMTPAEKKQRRAVIRANKAKMVMRDVVTLAINQAAPDKIAGSLLLAVLETMIKASGYSEDRAVGSRLDPSLKSGLKACVAKLGQAKGAQGQVAGILQILCSYAVSDSSGIRVDYSHGLERLAPELGIDLKKLQAGAFKVVDDLAAAKLKAREAKQKGK